MTTIFDGQDITLVWRPEKSDVAVVTFSSRQPPRVRGQRARSGFAENFLQANGLTGLHFIANRNHWWHSPDMDEALAASDALHLTKKYRRIVAYGSSMGGHGALLFAQRLGAQAALAFSPQFSLHDPALPIHPVWAREMQGIDERYAVTADCLLGVDTRVVYDPFHAFDAAHVRRIEALGPIGKVMAPFSGHETAKHLMQVGLLKSTVLPLLRGTFDPVTYRAAFAGQRRGSLTYWSGLRAKTRSGSVLQAAAGTEVERLILEKLATGAPDMPHKAAYAFILTRCRALVASGSADRAVALAVSYADTYPAFAHAHTLLAMVNLQAGLKSEALTAVEACIAISRRDVRARLLKGRILLAQGREADAAAAFDQALALPEGAQREWVGAVQELETSDLQLELKDRVLDRAVALNPGRDLSMFRARRARVAS